MCSTTRCGRSPRRSASVSVEQDADTGVVLINYSDGTTPPTLFTVDTIANASTRTSWRQLTDPNPQVRRFALGQQEEITWKSKDGTTVGGVLVKPVGYRAGQRYPLIVAIHGGPASADILSFNGGYGSQVYAGAGYVVLRPNYRGSTNYGNKLQTDIVGNYMAPGYDDIMAGVDHLIAQGIADPRSHGRARLERRRALVQLDPDAHRSLQGDQHRRRHRRTGSRCTRRATCSATASSISATSCRTTTSTPTGMQSPLKYIKNAKTPTMIHVVEGDPRVPSPQSIELHMALKQLGVPTELFMYPGNTHGIPDPAQSAGEVGERDGVDGLLRARHEHEVLVARRAEDAGRRGRRAERNVAAALARD